MDFWLFLKARDRLASFNLQSDLIKNLHRRFREEGIVINYPVRALKFPDGWNGKPPAGQALPQPEESPGGNGPD